MSDTEKNGENSNIPPAGVHGGAGDIQTDSTPKSNGQRQAGELFKRIGEDSLWIWFLGWLYKELKAMKEGWVIFLIMASVLCGAVYLALEEFVYLPEKTEMKGKISDLKDDIKALKYEISDIKRDLDDTQIKKIEAENALAPWKELANSQFPGKPINKSLDLLLQKIDAIQSELPDPLKEPISAASATADIEIEVAAPQPIEYNMFSGGVVSFSVGGDAVFVRILDVDDTFILVVGLTRLFI